MAHPLAVSSGKLGDAASQLSLHHVHTLTFFAVAAICMAFAVLPPFFVHLNRAWERRLYWSGVAGAALFAALGALPNWKLGAGIALFTVALMTASAYMNGPYIKIRGKTYAFYLKDSQPDPSPESTTDAPPGGRQPGYDSAEDSYGGMATAQKSWWANVVAVLIIVGCVLMPADDRPWIKPAVVSILVIAALVLGYGDASWRYPIARGQRPQFAIIAAITAGVFTVLYLIGYVAGRRWPLRRKQSMEYRAHPRHQRMDGR